MNLPRLPRPKLVIFDLDGTLIDSLSGVTAAANRLRRVFDLPPIDRTEVASYLGGPTRLVVARIVTRQMEPSLETAPVLAAQRMYPPIYREATQALVKPYPGVRGFLTTLDNCGVGIAVCTNKATELATANLADVGLGEFFAREAVLGSDALAECKPAPAPLLQLMTHFKVQAAETWMVGDGEADIGAARAARCSAIACAYGYGRAAQCQPDATIHCAGELLTLWHDQQLCPGR